MSHFPEQTEQSRPTHTVEDYLMTMHVLERDHGEIVAARLAEILQVTPATVAMTLKRMQRDNWIAGRGRQEGVHLTATGRAAADSVVRRHMLIEWLLLKVLKVPFLQIHAEAHNLEHAISPLLEERLVDILHNPKFCPHGNPFPGCEAAAQQWKPLAELPAGAQGVMRRLHEFGEEDQALLKFLHDNGLMPGAGIKVLEVLTFNQTMTLQVGEKQVMLGFAPARYVYVE